MRAIHCVIASVGLNAAMTIRPLQLLALSDEARAGRRPTSCA